MKVSVLVTTVGLFLDMAGAFYLGWGPIRRYRVRRKVRMEKRLTEEELYTVDPR